MSTDHLFPGRPPHIISQTNKQTKMLNFSSPLLLVWSKKGKKYFCDEAEVQHTFLRA